jgi:outer membrane murein-binding lipoprotein Lpp
MNEMKRRTLSIVLLTTILLLGIAVMPVIAADSDLKVVVQIKGGLEPGIHLQAAMEDFSNTDWSVVLGDISASDLTGADMLILIQSDMSVNYTTAEKAAVKSWFAGSGKTLWICADSDFSDQYMRINTANDMLANLDSKLRAEDCEAADPTSNANGADYRVFGLAENVDPEVAFIVDNVNKTLFHGPGLIMGYLGGSYYSLDETSLDGVYVIMTTSSDGIVVDFEPPAPVHYEVGYEGNLPLLVMEKYSNGNVLYAGADAPFAHYTSMYKPELKNYVRYVVEHTQDGTQLFQNIINYAIRTKSAANISALEADVSDLESDVSGLEGDVSTLEGQKATLEGQVDTLEADVTGLEGDVAGLEGDVTGLESTVSGLEDDLSKAESSASSWQMYAIGALILGAVVGFFVGPMLKK